MGRWEIVIGVGLVFDLMGGDATICVLCVRVRICVVCVCLCLVGHEVISGMPAVPW